MPHRTIRWATRSAALFEGVATSIRASDRIINILTIIKHYTGDPDTHPDPLFFPDKDPDKLNRWRIRNAAKNIQNKIGQIRL